MERAERTLFLVRAAVAILGRLALTERGGRLLHCDVVLMKDALFAILEELNDEKGDDHGA